MGTKKTNLPEFKIQIVSPLTVCEDTNPDFVGGVWSEMSPVILELDGRRAAVVSTNKSGAYKMLGNKTFMQANAYDFDSFVMVSKGNYSGEQGELLPPAQVPAYPFWKLNYYGAYDFFTVDGTLYSAMHGENKNERLVVDGARYEYRNTIRPNTTVYDESEYAGYASDGHYYDSANNYFAFIGLSHCPVDGLFEVDVFNKNDLGPIIWPDCGYLRADGTSASMGVRHPSAFVHESSVYVYYLEHNGGEMAIKVVRANLDSGAPLRFFKYSGTGFDIPATPFDAPTDDRACLYKGTAPSKPLFEASQPCRFSVAALAGTPYFIGVAEEMGGGRHTHCLRLSNDLVNWGASVEIPGVAANNWYQGVLHYPYITNTRFEKVAAVDPAAFCITGTFHDEANRGLPTPQYICLKLNMAEGEAHAG